MKKYVSQLQIGQVIKSDIGEFVYLYMNDKTRLKMFASTTPYLKSMQFSNGLLFDYHNSDLNKLLNTKVKNKIESELKGKIIPHSFYTSKYIGVEKSNSDYQFYVRAISALEFDTHKEMFRLPFINSVWTCDAISNKSVCIIDEYGNTKYDDYGDNYKDREVIGKADVIIVFGLDGNTMVDILE